MTNEKWIAKLGHKTLTINGVEIPAELIDASSLRIIPGSHNDLGRIECAFFFDAIEIEPGALDVKFNWKPAQ